MGVEERNPEEAKAAQVRNMTGLAYVIGGFCIVLITIAADADGPVKACNCWTALSSPAFVINSMGHVASSVFIFLGGKKMDW